MDDFMGLGALASSVYSHAMSTVKEIEAAIPKLSRAEIEELRGWIENFLEDQAELSDTATARIEESRREIARGDYTTRQPS
jgi:hypothetical protein